MTKPRKPLNADAYDALEFSALAFGGIGGSQWWRDADGLAVLTSRLRGDAAPCCGEGHAISVCAPDVNDVTGDRELREMSPVYAALHDIGITYEQNDKAVCAINKKLGRAEVARVTWKRYANHFGIVRADS